MYFQTKWLFIIFVFILSMNSSAIDINAQEENAQLDQSWPFSKEFGYGELMEDTPEDLEKDNVSGWDFLQTPAIVYDSYSGLIWSESTSSYHSGDSVSFDVAELQCAKMYNKAKSGWISSLFLKAPIEDLPFRLPTLTELLSRINWSIKVEYGDDYDHSLEYKSYWTNTPMNRIGTNDKFVAVFNDKTMSVEPQSTSSGIASFICVSDSNRAKKIVSRFNTNKLTAKDKVTGLVWLRKAQKIALGESPITACAKKTTNSYKWRLPTIREHYSLLDLFGGKLTIDPLVFSDRGRMLSISKIPKLSSNRFGIDEQTGQTIHFSEFVRCVSDDIGNANLGQYNGSIHISTLDDYTDFIARSYTSIIGDLTLDLTSLKTVKLPKLESVFGNINIFPKGSSSSKREIHLPQLTLVEKNLSIKHGRGSDLKIETANLVVKEALEIFGNEEMKGIEIQGVKKIGSLRIVRNDSLSNINLQSLKAIKKNIKIEGNNDFSNLQIQDVEKIVSLQIIKNNSLSNINLQSLKAVEENIEIKENNDLNNFQVKKIKEVNSIQIDANTRLNNVNLGPLKVVRGDLLIRNNSELNYVKIRQLRSVDGNLEITDNPKFCERAQIDEVLIEILKAHEIPNKINISGNDTSSPGCIKSNCPNLEQCKYFDVKK